MSVLEADPFSLCRDQFEMLVGFLAGDQAAQMSHGELEHRVGSDGREVLRLALQGHLDRRAETEERLGDVTDCNGVGRGSVEPDHERGLSTIFGEVIVRRLAYRRRGHANLHPADGTLNLPSERHSHGLRELAAIEASRGSFEAVIDAIERSTGQRVGKRQAEDLARRTAVDFEGFYTRSAGGDVEQDDVIVLSCDGKGIVMRKDSLRPATRKAAAKSTGKLSTRLSKGEKANRKRMAEVGTVYEVTPAPRVPADILCSGQDTPAPAPVAKAKWLTASVADDAATVVRQIFDQAERRDPCHERAWVALVDGNNHQIDRINAEAEARAITVPIVVDLIHVLEYLWGAAWSFFCEGDVAAENWVRDKAFAVLDGESSIVAGAIRRKATCLGLDKTKRANADSCADYLLHKGPYLDYPAALAAGWPIATGVIEGACRHLVKDRMDLTGARWSLAGAEAVLKLRALRSNHDWADYWAFHLDQERQRVHRSRYANEVIPMAA
jgi:hypothetical protein